MSIAVIKHQIEKFLVNDAPEVMAIKGAWGTGKTYSWRKFLEESKAQKKITLGKYSYVSLFGINSLNELKQAIFECVISRELIGTEPSIETFKANMTAVSSSLGRKALDFLSNVPVFRNFTSTIDSLSFLSLNKTLICIDDLERKGSKLDIKDVLGLVSQLKEQKKCKIVLLLNDAEDGLDYYIKFREKVVDIELKFAPTASECAAIAFDTQGDVHVTLRELSENLGISNIRILKKLERLVNLALPFSTGYEKEIKYQFIHSLTLFTWCCFSSDKETPTLEYVTNMGYSSYGIGEGKDVIDEHNIWNTLLDKYNYRLTDELDLVLAEAVHTGYFLENRLKLAAEKKNNQVLADKSDASFTQAWGLYHDSFENNQQEVIDTIYESFKSNAKNISPTKLNGTVNLFRGLGEKEKTSEIIDFYINLRSEEIDLFDLEKGDFFGDKLDKELQEKLVKIKILQSRQKLKYQIALEEIFKTGFYYLYGN